MSYPEIIFIAQSNNPSPFLQKFRMLSKSILNKNTKKCRSIGISSDSSEGFFPPRDPRKARYAKAFGHLSESVKTACSGTRVQKPKNAETDQSFFVTALQCGPVNRPATGRV
ncbi:MULTISPECIES: hypothetical protein [Pseudomonas]|uniref:hypothetical protein n=1 Tax=Pseudomonas TaxID=286 RepID=UPI00111BD04F|nr:MULTISPECIES: hypothetical protein [Pseudomonas]MCX4218378.1 hypothetical protein [Pseudomonas sp. MCal1]UIN55485.1 hypothetical protein LXN51_03875 [Pseudomonas kribbensis]